MTTVDLSWDPTLTLPTEESPITESPALKLDTMRSILREMTVFQPKEPVPPKRHLVIEKINTSPIIIPEPAPLPPEFNSMMIDPVTQIQIPMLLIMPEPKVDLYVIHYPYRLPPLTLVDPDPDVMKAEMEAFLNEIDIRPLMLSTFRNSWDSGWSNGDLMGVDWVVTQNPPQPNPAAAAYLFTEPRALQPSLQDQVLEDIDREFIRAVQPTPAAAFTIPFTAIPEAFVRGPSYPVTMPPVPMPDEFYSPRAVPMSVI